jgi:DNA polymerase III alpha subunit (gram-positive type)
MPYLFFDTETTGIPAGADHIFMVQLAWILTDDKGNRLAQADLIVRPDDFVIPDIVAEIHGITQARALAEGHLIDHVLCPFVAVLRFPGLKLVGHNIKFDLKVVGKEFERLNWENELHGLETICTMSSSTDICNIPRRGGGLKTPKLAELYCRLFDCGFDEQHRAMADTEAMMKCFWELRKLGVL